MAHSLDGIAINVLNHSLNMLAQLLSWNMYLIMFSDVSSSLILLYACMWYQSVVQTLPCTHCLLQEHSHNNTDHSRCVCGEERV